MLVYVCFDGDGIGQMVGRARLADDVESIRKISQSIDLGNEIWKSWALRTGGSIIEMGGDEGALEIPADHLDELPAMREQYGEKVNATVSVGVGLKISEAAKALVVAKLQGKDRVVFFSEECDTIIEKAKAHAEKTEEQKINDEYLTDSNLNKAAPAMNPGAFTGVSSPSGATVDKPTKSQGDHEEGQTLYDQLDSEDAPKPAEATHAASDFEQQLHDEAWKGHDEDMQNDSKKSGNLEKVKAQIVQAMQVLKVQQPVLDQIKQASPQTYQAMLALTSAVVGMARELAPSADMKKSEAGESKADIYGQHVLEAGGPPPAEHCADGRCYAHAEALYHLLGGPDSETTPCHTNGHWFLKDRDGTAHDVLGRMFGQDIDYDAGKPADFVTPQPSESAQKLIDTVLAQPLGKGGLPMPHASAHHEVTLPVGSTLNGKLKVEHQDGSDSWKSVGSGEIRSMDPAGHATSSRTPNSR